MPGNDFGADGFNDLARKLESFADRIETASTRLRASDADIDPAVERTARLVAGRAVELAPEDTGELKASNEVEKLSDGSWLVKFTADHAKPQEYGARPHPITPDEADALRFEWRGEIVFRQFVFHPGNEAQPFLRPALDEHEKVLPREIVDEIEDVLDDVL